MPYVINTYLPGGCLQPIEAGQEPDASRAVAALEEAHTAVNAAHPQASRDIHDLPGTVGPLPDGTVIEVASVTWAQLVDAPGYRLGRISAHRRARIIDAYNAREARA